MEFKGSQTEKNLFEAFTGESRARNKYLFYAEKAGQENHPEIKELFERMAKNEGVHGKLLFQKLYNGIGTSTANLKDAMEGEYGEWTSMYPEFAKTAREEGFEDIATLFENISKIEKDHEGQFLTALSELIKGKKASSAGEPSKPKAVLVDGYRCMFCGASYKSRPDVCSVCGAIGSFEAAKVPKQ